MARTNVICKIYSLSNIQFAALHVQLSSEVVLKFLFIKTLHQFMLV